MPPRALLSQEDFKFKYSICTLANKLSEYGEMVDSFVKAGFEERDCEFLYADNSQENAFEAFGGINRFLREAKGEYVIICHQDILITINDRQKLEQQIEQVTYLDPNWAVLGNAGANNMYNMSMIVTHTNLKSHNIGVLPSKVQSLDENFLLVKATANLTVAGDLKGFHMYGTDICLIAECLGYSAFAIDFHLVHKGFGILDESFYQLSGKIQKKYSSFFRGRYIRTTVTSFYLSSNRYINMIMNITLMKILVKKYYKLSYMLSGKL